MTTQETIQFELTNPPTDGITKVQWCNHSNSLLASSWDKSVTLYDINSPPNTRVIQSYQHKAGVLDCCITDDDLKMFSGGCDCNLITCDIKTGVNSIIGSHNQPIKCVKYSSEGNMIITGSWDKSIKLWDIRNNNPLITHVKDLPGKIFAMSTSHNNLIIGTSDRYIYIYDIRNMNEPEQKRESSLKHQIRSITFHPNGQQYIVSSIEGRVAVEYIDPNPIIQSKKYAFKCHRAIDKQNNIQTIYPVNTITFHPIFKTFATGGSDGIVNIWDGDNKKKICQFLPYNTSISSLSFNNDGSLLAVSQSYCWEQGHLINHEKDAIFIRYIRENEAKPKKKSDNKK